VTGFRGFRFLGRPFAGATADSAQSAAARDHGSRHAECVIPDNEPCVFDSYARVSARVHRHIWRFSLRFLQCVLWLNDTSYGKVSAGTNRNMPVRNTLVQLLGLYTNPECQNAQRHRLTDRQTDKQTDDRMMPIADHTV